MYKKITLIVLTLVMLMYSIPAQAVSFNLSGDDSEESGTVESSEADTSSDEDYGISLYAVWEYDVGDFIGTSINANKMLEGISSSSLSKEVLEIPENTYNSIQGNAFSKSKALRELIVPSTVTGISSTAFTNSTIRRLVIHNREGKLSGEPWGLSGDYKIVYDNYIVDSGYCGGEGDGTNLTWTLYDDGLLEITGTGDMKDYPISTTTAPWGFYNNSLTRLSIGEGITSIGEYAFERCSGITGTLTIPNSVTSIGSGAFYKCSGFTGNLTIPDSVTSIGGYTFAQCSGFTGNLTIPNSVTSIGIDAFYKCSGFTGDLIIPDSVTSIGIDAFIDCSGFTGDLIIPDSVTSIGNHVFYGCSGFTGDLIIQNGVTSIGKYAFYNCSGLKGNLVIPDSVTSIDSTAFKNCTGITDVNIAKAPDELANYPWGLEGKYKNANLVFHWNCEPNTACKIDITVPNVEWTGGEVKPSPIVTDN